jgi:hypothetical protein
MMLWCWVVSDVAKDVVTSSSRVKMKVVEDNSYSTPVFCFDQLVVVKEEDGGRKAVYC